MFTAVLSELKIACLDSRRKAVRQKYQENVDIYVRELMGRPLEKIHVSEEGNFWWRPINGKFQLFFERIERLLENGVRPEEISYEQQFSRMELKRAIQAYSAKEVKRGLESLYKKVEKHLSQDSPLLQVVWRQMQVPTPFYRRE
jgi:exocyst complex component 1